MATLALSRAFLDEFAKLEKPLRNKVQQHVDTFARLSAAELYGLKGLHLEPHTGAADPRARTIRIDDNHRGIVMDAGNDDLFILTSVGTHDQTDRWMAHNTFKVNAATGALEVLDVEAIEAQVAAATATPTNGHPPIFAHRKDKDFNQLGIDPGLLPALRAFTDQDQLGAILHVLPEGQAEALIQLLSADTVETIYAQIAGQTVAAEPFPDDLAAAMERPATRAAFRVIDGQEALQDILAQPLAHWRLFLHPTQHDLVHRTYNGAVRVTGGAGTGKTVAAIHRARALADRLEPGTTGKPILFTTFTRNLAQAIEQDLRDLGGPDLLDVVDIVNVDRLSYRIVQEAEGAGPTPINDDEIRTLWQEVADETDTGLPPEFLHNEWEQVILAQDLTSRSEYFTASRAGRGIPLDRRQRAAVWKAVEAFTQRLVDRNKRTYLQLAGAAAGYVKARTTRPYRHVIVDEGQDLHEAQWRLLRALVDEGPDDLFIVGDAHQRIYDRRSSLSKVGINIRGRSRKLKINYRTTHEILRWSLTVLGESDFDDLDEGTDAHDFAGYHSYRNGPEPEMMAFKSRQEQIQALVAKVNQWVADGVPEDHIGIAARTRNPFSAIQRALEANGRDVCILPTDLPRATGVRIGTMHRMKGLEFPRVAIVDVDDRTIPHAAALTDPTDDPARAEADLKRELCLLYVAATRARDELWVSWAGKPSRFVGPLLPADE